MQVVGDQNNFAKLPQILSQHQISSREESRAKSRAMAWDTHQLYFIWRKLQRRHRTEFTVPGPVAADASKPRQNLGGGKAALDKDNSFRMGQLC